MLSVGKMHSRAKSRSCENYLCIKVKLFFWKSLLHLCVCLLVYMFFLCIESKCEFTAFSAEPCVVIVHIKGMDVLFRLEGR